MPAYNVAATAIALGVDPKWVDNVLSHYSIPGVHSVRQGITRRLDPEAIRILAITVALTRAFGTPTSRAIELASQLAQAGRIAEGPLLTLSLDLTVLDADLRTNLIEAVEATPLRRRGRPPKTPS